jgi:hypothetical protein
MAEHTTEPAEDEPGQTMPERSVPPGPTEEAVARGRAAATPFVLLGSVAVTIWSVVAIVTAAVLLVWWLG